MKTKVFSVVLTFFLLSGGFMGCSKDDKVSIDQLVGKWGVANDDPNLCVDGSITYTFNEDKTCAKRVYDALGGRDTVFHSTYLIGNNQRLITLFNDSNQYTEQYHIHKLNGSEMKWENASPNDGNTLNQRLVRVTN